MAGQDQTLPGKDAALFRTLVKLYESKQHKKGIKTADQILKKYPDHGETLAMKGLILSQSGGKRDEAYEYTRRGLKANLKSHVCWHVYGCAKACQRGDRAVSVHRLLAVCLSSRGCISSVLINPSRRLLYRGDNNYEEALKCYKQAVRIDKDNITILRDLAMLQVGGIARPCPRQLSLSSESYKCSVPCGYQLELIRCAAPALLVLRD